MNANDESQKKRKKNSNGVENRGQSTVNVYEKWVVFFSQFKSIGFVVLVKVVVVGKN